MTLAPGAGIDVASVARFAAPNLLARERTERATIESAAPLPAAFGAASASHVALGLALAALASLSLLLAARKRRPAPARVKAADAPRARVDYEQRCRAMIETAGVLRRRAEAAVLDMDESLPLRALLLGELRQVGQRLSTEARQHAAEAGVLSVLQTQDYWRTFGRAIQQCVRDLQRIGDLADAARASFGDKSTEPRVPKTLSEAYFVLGANSNVDLATLQRLVKALRQCWHPDFAQVEQDRRYREARLKQINVAFDLISGKRQPG